VTPSTVLAVLALVASVVLLMQKASKIFAIVAVVASGLEVLMAFHVFRLSVTRIPLGLVLGAALAIAGVILYSKVHAKVAVACATVITLAGALQVLASI